MKKRILIIISTLIIITGLTSIAYAFYISKDKANNKFTVGNLTENINEDFKEPDSWNGQDISKKVWVENTNTMPEIIRVAIEPRFEDKDGNFFSGNINYIKFNYANVTTNINDTIASDTLIKGKGSSKLYFMVYVNNIGSDQSEEDKDGFTGTVTVSATSGEEIYVNFNES